jgi:hypothetical protein
MKNRHKQNQRKRGPDSEEKIETESGKSDSSYTEDPVTAVGERIICSGRSVDLWPLLPDIRASNQARFLVLGPY